MLQFLNFALRPMETSKRCRPLSQRSAIPKGPRVRVRAGVRPRVRVKLRVKVRVRFRVEGLETYKTTDI